MKPGKPYGMGRARSGKGRSWLVLALIVVGLVSFSCRRPAAPPPPPPAAEPAPPPPPPAPTITISASPATLTAGESTTLQWTAQNANAVSIEPGIGTVAASGTRSESPDASVTYTATATGPGGTDTANVRVTVNQPPPPPPPPPAPEPEPTIEELFRSNVVSIYFDYDESEIRADQIADLQGNARFMEQNAGVQFTISGHADERGTQEYNIGLGDRRANTVREFLEEQGIAASRINVISFGEERPVCSEDDEACWSQNRRAEFALR